MKSTRYLISNILFASSFLFSAPALAQKLNRTGGNANGSACLCLRAVRESVTTSWTETQAAIEALKDTHAAEMSTCGRGGGVFVGGTTCQPVASLRGPTGPVGDRGPEGDAGKIIWQSLSTSAAGGFAGGTGAGAYAGGGTGGGSEGFGDTNGDGVADTRGAGYGNTCSGCSTPGSSPSGGSGGGASRVICTELYRQGYIPRHIYAANVAHYRKYARPEAARAYHAWGVPYVRLMRRSKLATAIARPIFTTWAYQMAYEMGATDRPPRFGVSITRFLTGIHNWIGRLFFSAAISTRPTYAVQDDGQAYPLGALALVPDDFFRTSVKAGA
ncbi:hypothetical protein PJ900_12245 [Tistrella mobilis]|uniref:hypothetical protein n=1 Tax=Tistrella mobilis TaxID=171437 RepID=UPI000A7AEA67|nr:hypothetical protein [Tistrella mobilis]